MPPVKHPVVSKTTILLKVDPTECPFREFRDNELSPEFWGLGPAAFRIVSMVPKLTGKQTQSTLGGHPGSMYWQDDQTQPLPNSVRHYLDGWVAAEELAMSRWECEVVVFDENSLAKISVIDYQLSHAQVLMRSSFCRRVLSACFNLERAEGVQIEHTWENFNFVYGPEGWRARYHIYSPGLKAGGGSQHRPTLSKNGCYLVRLFYLGAWRCVWVSDQVPVDASGSPLLPFSPLSSPSPVKGKGIPAMVTASNVQLWPLLLCKALLKIAAPDMTINEETVEGEEDDTAVEDELMPEFDLMHTMTGGFSTMYFGLDGESLWKTLLENVKLFNWDDDYDDMQSSTAKSRSTRKPNPKDKDKELKQLKKNGISTLFLHDSKEIPPYMVPGITPGMEMSLVTNMIRDLPLKRPLPEPEVALWKHYRWIDWARRHGLYEAYDCPRTRYLKVNGLMKLSYAPHLIDLQSTESITRGFREEQQTEKVKTKASTPASSVARKQKTGKDAGKQMSHTDVVNQLKEELREWVQYVCVFPLIKGLNVVDYPSVFEFTTAASNPSVRIVKVANRALDMQAPKASPLYLQIDGPEENVLSISLQMIHPRILANNGYTIDEHIEKAYVLLERFEWFIDKEVSRPDAYIQTRGYDTVAVKFLPGRHFCRLWVHSRMHWHVALLSESALVLGTRDVIQVAACVECPWVSKFLNNLGNAFLNWIRFPRSNFNFMNTDRDFFSSYQPDLTWDPKVVGYEKTFVHWMFRQALQSLLAKRLQQVDYQMVFAVLRRYFCDPDLGFPPKPKPPKSLREIIERDPCDCLLPEVEFQEEEENQDEQSRTPESEEVPENPVVSEQTMMHLLKEPQEPYQSHVCDLATEEVPCGLLKIEREKMVKKHEAATCIQAYWRGSFARKCLSMHVVITPEVLKLLTDNVFGNQESLSMLMNEFFLLFPGAKYAYSISAALAGTYGLQQHNGISPVSPKCKWIPYFQGVFYCHAPVKVHFDVHSSIEHCTVQIYDNDTGENCPQAYNAHITFDIHPNIYGYTVLGHGSYNQPLGYNSEVHWQLTVMTSIDQVFHVCDNEIDGCNILPLNPAAKLHIDEMYIPNRRNILGGIQITVNRVEFVSFRAAATTPDLEMEAILRTTDHTGEVVEMSRCRGKGEIFWPYIRLKPASTASEYLLKKTSYSSNTLQGTYSSIIAKGIKAKSSNKKAMQLQKSFLKLGKAPIESKTYTIQVVATEGWALPAHQWKRIEEVRQDIEIPKLEIPTKKPAKDKTTSAKDKKKDDSMFSKDSDKIPIFTVHTPLLDDAYTELECSTTVGGGAYARRDDERDILFATVLRSWEMKEPGRNVRGSGLRQEFRDEFLVPPTPSKTSTVSEIFEEAFEEEQDKTKKEKPAGPSPATESGILEMEGELEEEAFYFTMPEKLKDKFVPLYFVPECTKEISEEEPVVLTEDMTEAAKQERASHLEAAMERMRQLQEWNLQHVLGRQDYRIELLDKLLIDGSWGPELATVMDERNEAIAREQIERQLSAAKKKQEAKAQVMSKVGGNKLTGKKN